MCTKSCRMTTKMVVIFKQRHRHHIITFTVVYFNFCFGKKIFFYHTPIHSWFFFWKLFGEIHFQNFVPKWLPCELFVALCEVKSDCLENRLKRCGAVPPIFWAYVRVIWTSSRITRAIVRRGVILGQHFESEFRRRI